MRISDWSSDVCSSVLIGMDVVQAFGDLLPRVHVSAATADFTPFKPVFGTSGLPQSLACGSGNQILEIGVATAFRHSERSEEHTSELQSLMRISYAVFCLKIKKTIPI